MSSPEKFGSRESSDDSEDNEDEGDASPKRLHAEDRILPKLEREQAMFALGVFKTEDHEKHRDRVNEEADKQPSHTSFSYRRSNVLGDFHLRRSFPFSKDDP